MAGRHRRGERGSDKMALLARGKRGDGLLETSGVAGLVSDGGGGATAEASGQGRRYGR